MCMHAKLLWLCPTLCNAKDWYPPGSSVHGILQVRILGWAAISFSRDLPYPGIFPTQGSSQPRDRTHISMSPALADRFLVLPEKSKFKRQWEENVWRHQGLGGERYFWKYQAIYFHRQGRVHMRAGVWPWHSGQFIMTHYPKAFTDWTCIFIFPVF